MAVCAGINTDGAVVVGFEVTGLLLEETVGSDDVSGPVTGAFVGVDVTAT